MRRRHGGRVGPTPITCRPISAARPEALVRSAAGARAVGRLHHVNNNTAVPAVPG
jgi:hypothetical protein